jgi:hypothetical protein
MYARDGRVEATKGVPFGFAASFVVAEHLTFKLERLGRRVRTIRSSGFGLPDDLLGIERGRRRPDRTPFADRPDR